jgi:hypothetical protein
MPGTAEGRAVFSLFILFCFLLFVAVFSAGAMMKFNAGRERIPERDIAEHVNAFYAGPVEVTALPESPLTLGNGELTISVFTDFLCGRATSFTRWRKSSSRATGAASASPTITTRWTVRAIPP